MSLSAVFRTFPKARTACFLCAGSECGAGGAYVLYQHLYIYSAPTHNTTTIVISGDNKPIEHNPNSGDSVAANMSTLSVLTIAAAAAAVLKMKKH